MEIGGAGIAAKSSALSRVPDARGRHRRALVAVRVHVVGERMWISLEGWGHLSGNGDISGGMAASDPDRGCRGAERRGGRPDTRWIRTPVLISSRYFIWLRTVTASGWSGSVAVGAATSCRRRSHPVAFLYRLPSCPCRLPAHAPCSRNPQAAHVAELASPAASPTSP